MKKYIILFLFVLNLASCSFVSRERKFAVLSNEKINNFNIDNAELKDFEYKYCDGVILMLIPTGFKAVNDNYVINRGIKEYNVKNNTNYNAIINATITTKNNFYIPFYYNGCNIIKGKITKIN